MLANSLAKLLYEEALVIEHRPAPDWGDGPLVERIGPFPQLDWGDGVAAIGDLYRQLQRKGPEPETILLWPEGAPGAKGAADADRPALDLYILSGERANGAAVVVFPGGGYRYLAWQRHT